MQLPCDAQLSDRLREAKRHRTPVVIFADPWTVGIQPYRKALEDYDELNLLNCAVLVAWNRDDPETEQCRQRLMNTLRQVCPQKMKLKYPGHYWEITSSADLRAYSQLVLDEITLRLLDDAREGELKKAESTQLEQMASDQGIRTDAVPQLQNTPMRAGG